LLLVANLAALTWIMLQPVQQPPEYQPLPLPPGIEPLVLLSERKSKPELPVGPSEASLHPAPDQVVAEEPEAVVEVETSGDHLAVSEPAGAEIKAEAEMICQTMGPLMKETDAQAMVELLSSQGFTPRIRSSEVRQPTGYWVYMPAMPAREARRIVAKLEANGMKDYFIGKQNYISLGIFSRKEKAQSRLNQVQALGFDAVLDRRYRTQNIYWIDIDEPQMPLLGSDLWTQIQTQHADIRVQRVSCD
jgi:hypothetical protein